MDKIVEIESKLNHLEQEIYECLYIIKMDNMSMQMDKLNRIMWDAIDEVTEFNQGNQYRYSVDESGVINDIKRVY